VVCDTCAANNYCPTPLLKLGCPQNTISVTGVSSQLGCRCNPGYVCSYTKKIQATFTLNITADAFQNNTGGVRDKFIAAIAAAAGVPTSKVIINGVKIRILRRRLLSEDDSGGGGIDVTTSIEGAHKLLNVERHMATKQGLLLQSHKWHEAHTVHTVSVSENM
jgi:hypothetical protein